MNSPSATANLTSLGGLVSPGSVLVPNTPIPSSVPSPTMPSSTKGLRGLLNNTPQTVVHQMPQATPVTNVDPRVVRTQSPSLSQTPQVTQPVSSPLSGSVRSPNLSNSFTRPLSPIRSSPVSSTSSSSTQVVGTNSISPPRSPVRYPASIQSPLPGNGSLSSVPIQTQVVRPPTPNTVVARVPTPNSASIINTTSTGSIASVAPLVATPIAAVPLATSPLRNPSPTQLSYPSEVPQVSQSQVVYRSPSPVRTSSMLSPAPSGSITNSAQVRLPSPARIQSMGTQGQMLTESPVAVADITRAVPSVSTPGMPNSPIGFGSSVPNMTSTLLPMAAATTTPLLGSQVVNIGRTDLLGTPFSQSIASSSYSTTSSVSGSPVLSNSSSPVSRIGSPSSITSPVQSFSMRSPVVSPMSSPVETIANPVQSFIRSPTVQSPSALVGTGNTGLVTSSLASPVVETSVLSPMTASALSYPNGVPQPTMKNTRLASSLPVSGSTVSPVPQPTRSRTPSPIRRNTVRSTSNNTPPTLGSMGVASNSTFETLTQSSVEMELLAAGYIPREKVIVGQDGGALQGRFIKAINQFGQPVFIELDGEGFISTQPGDMTMVETKTATVVPSSIKMGYQQCLQYQSCGVAFECHDGICTLINDTQGTRETNLVYTEKRSEKAVFLDGEVAAFPVIRLSEIRANPREVLRMTDVSTKRIRRSALESADADLRQFEMQMNELSKSYAEYMRVKSDLQARLSNVTTEMEGYENDYLNQPPVTIEGKAKNQTLIANLYYRNQMYEALINQSRILGSRNAQLANANTSIRDATNILTAYDSKVNTIIGGEL